MPSLISSLVAVICLGAMPLVVSALGGGRAIANAAANNNREIDINAVVQQSARVTEADREASSDYEFSETDWEPNGSHRTYAVHILYGSPYRQLIAIDGEPLPETSGKRKCASCARRSSGERTNRPGSERGA